MKYVCVYVTMPPHYYDFDFKLTSDVKNQPVIQKLQARKTFSYHGLAVALIVQNLTGEFMRRNYAAS